MKPLFFARLAQGLTGEPLDLPLDLIRKWPELADARYRRGGLPPRVGGWALRIHSVAGIALGRTVWLAPGTALDPELLLHELRHVQQFREHRGFALRYVWETIRRGYRANAFEVDARAFAARRMKSDEMAAGAVERPTSKAEQDAPVGP